MMKIGESWLLRVALSLFGTFETRAIFTQGCNVKCEGILFGRILPNLHYSIMLSYLGLVITMGYILTRILFSTKKYGFSGLVISLLIALDISYSHFSQNLPVANLCLFVMGMVVSLFTFFLMYTEKQRIKLFISSVSTWR